MKKLVVVSILAAMLLAMGVAAMADATNWQFRIQATNTAGLYPGGETLIGWFKNYTNGIDGGEQQNVPPAPAVGGTATVCAVFASNGSQTMRDMREPLSNANGDYSKMGLPRTWTFNVFTQGTWAADAKIRVTFKPQAGAVGIFPVSTLPNGAKVELRGAINDTITAANFAAKTSSWYYDIGGDGVYSKTSPLVFTMTVTPEPSSVFALASGLAGLAGFAIRRRK